jgi:hypothetical protein
MWVIFVITHNIGYLFISGTFLPNHLHFFLSDVASLVLIKKEHPGSIPEHKALFTPEF